MTTKVDIDYKDFQIISSTEETTEVKPHLLDSFIDEPPVKYNV